jgi:hypothetical protein
MFERGSGGGRIAGMPPGIEGRMVLALARDSDEHALDALVRSEGSAGAIWIAHLLDACDARDLSDAAHGLCQLYGSHPTCIDTAALRVTDPVLKPWLRHAAEGFTAERNFLALVVAAAGPTPSTPGQAQSEAALVGQRHALEVLACSDRVGCAIGAAVALVLDWRAVRPVLDRLAIRAGITPPPTDLPADGPCDLLDDRARLFGVRQLLTQQRQLWSLLEARAAARGRR